MDLDAYNYRDKINPQQILDEHFKLKFLQLYALIQMKSYGVLVVY